MSRLTWDAAKELAQDAGSALGQAIKAAGEMYCDFIRQYPNWSLQNPLGLDPFQRAINDELCGPEYPPLPPPLPPIPGGKCRCVLYRVTWSGTRNGEPLSGYVDVNGPIGALQKEKIDADIIRAGFYHQNSLCNGWEVFGILQAGPVEGWSDGRFDAQITSIVRLDGQPDQCAPDLPYYPPVIPPAPILRRDVNITFGPGVAVNIPIILVRPDIEINPDIDFNIDFSPHFDLPDINIDIKFDIGGVDINPRQPDTGAPYIPPADPRTNPPKLPGDDLDKKLKPVKDSLTSLSNKVDELEKCACPEVGIKRTIQYGLANSSRVSVPQRVESCTIELVQIPSNARGQAGISAPNVIYSGWGWFIYEDDGLSERMPVDAQNKSFIPPRPNPVAFAYTLQAGFTGILRVHWREVED